MPRDHARPIPKGAKRRLSGLPEVLHVTLGLLRWAVRGGSRQRLRALCEAGGDPDAGASTPRIDGRRWLDARQPSREQVAAHLVNLAWNGLSRLDPTPLKKQSQDRHSGRHGPDPAAGAAG